MLVEGASTVLWACVCVCVVLRAHTCNSQLHLHAPR